LKDNKPFNPSTLKLFNSTLNRFTSLLLDILNDLKMTPMKNIALLLLISGTIFITSCNDKDTESDKFNFLTTPTWVTDSLLVNGFDASGPAGLLQDFKGDVKFNEDGSGSFGNYTGTWRFAFNETQLVISTDSLPLPLTSKIVELTQTSLKLTTSYPNPLNPTSFMDIRMTFKPK